MAENQGEGHPKRLQFIPHSVVVRAFNRYKDGEGHKSEAKALETLTREGLQRAGYLSSPKDK